jgi:hypothetical protein
MSNLFIKGVTGTGVFATPSSDRDIDAMNAAIRSVLGGISALRFMNCNCDVIESEGANTDVCVSVESIEYNGSICPDSASIRASIMSAFMAHPDVTSLGPIDIKKAPEGAFYHSYPFIDFVDGASGIVHMVDNVPPQAQIEVYKYTRKRTGPHDNYDSHLGKRYRPDRLMARGALQLNLSTEFLARRRAHYRFAFRWPIPGNTGGAGVRGPLGPTTVSTATPVERSQGVLLVITPAPSGFARH